MDVNSCLRCCFSQRGFPPLTTAAYRCYWLPQRLRLASTTCFYDLSLWPASTACLYDLPLWPASTACLYGCLHHVIAIIIIIIVHLLFKRNIYLSLLHICDLCVFSSSFLEIIFHFFF
jgi:hypothetical protein